MNNLININKVLVGLEEVNSINSRELYTELGFVNKTNYSKWIKKSIADYNFIENEDFLLVQMDEQNRNGSGGSNKIDYIITVDMAKELAMLSKTAKGREIRKYFIKVEKEFQQQLLIEKDVEIAKMKEEKKLCILTPEGFSSCRGIAQRSKYSEKQVRDFAEKHKLIESKVKATLYWNVITSEPLVEEGPKGTPYYNLEAMVDVMDQYYNYGEE